MYTLLELVRQAREAIIACQFDTWAENILKREV